MATQPQGTFLGHPKGLFVLFFTEMWERFNYYGMRALLILYMVNYFKWPQEQASGVYKWFTSLVYLTPLIGGFLADKYLGNKWAIILGASTMAIGQFCMAIASEQFFYISLGLLIIGNGLFKPNMATQVGRLYPPNDARRDSAYTIFYMGVNLGAFIAPIVCSALRKSAWGYSAGFAAAGVGMLIGLVTYLAGLKWVQAVPTDAVPAPSRAPGDRKGYLTEQEAQNVPSVIPEVARLAPKLMLLAALAVILIPWALVALGALATDDAIAYSGPGGVAALMGWLIMQKIAPALRDRVLVVYLLGLFVIFFWAAFEQAGNAMNIFADKTTNRFIWHEPPMPMPESTTETLDAASTATGFARSFNPVPTEWFQSINALAIFILGPVFAWFWVTRLGVRFSIPAKMALGIFLQGLAFALMIWAIRYENQPSGAHLAALPPGVHAQADGRVVFRDAPGLGDDKWQEKIQSKDVDPKAPGIVHGGRIHFDAAAKKLNITGVLADTDRDRILRATVSPAFLAKARELAIQSKEIKKDDATSPSVSVTLDETPPGFDLRYAGQKETDLTYDPATKRLTTKVALADRDYKGILVAGAEPNFRGAIGMLYVDSAKYKVSSWWLFWFYILCTLGELCLSPVGLSMVSKLAPAAYATMMMGIWHVMISFGNYFAGQLGESYGVLHPASYFAYITVALTIASLICYFLARKIKSMMHGAN